MSTLRHWHLLACVGGCELPVHECAPPTSPPASAWVCPKCFGVHHRTEWHAGSIASRSNERVCGYRDVTTTSAEHMHHYCQTCHFDWTTPVAAAAQEPTDAKR